MDLPGCCSINVGDKNIVLEVLSQLGAWQAKEKQGGNKKWKTQGLRQGISPRMFRSYLILSLIVF